MPTVTRSRSPILRLWLVLLMGTVVLSCCAQSSGQDLQMRIILEERTGSAFRIVSPQHVFKTGDMVRFRVRSSSDGYLYVSNRGASGKYSELFPARGADSDNRLEHGRDYRIPSAARSWFRIEKPAGYETVFFTFTYSQLRGRNNVASVLPKPMEQAVPAELIPRCDDAMFRARGECLDVNAGPSAVPPGTLAGSEAPTPRDITIVPGPDSSVVSPAGPGNTPIVYEFRIAHR
jgi:Domain of unknown function (DUF4384)